MEQNRINNITHRFLVNLAQLSYVEESAIYNLIRDFDALFVYLTRNIKAVTLFNELDILIKFILIQRLQFGDRFGLIIDNKEEYKNYFIDHLSIIDFIDSLFSSSLENTNEYVSFNIDIEILKEHIKIALLKQVGKSDEIVIKKIRNI
jgi:LytS/YehU family sensor histidine kinase